MEGHARITCAKDRIDGFIDVDAGAKLSASSRVQKYLEESLGYPVERFVLVESEPADAAARATRSSKRGGVQGAQSTRRRSELPGVADYTAELCATDIIWNPPCHSSEMMVAIRDCQLAGLRFIRHIIQENIPELTDTSVNDEFLEFLSETVSSQYDPPGRRWGGHVPPRNTLGCRAPKRGAPVGRDAPRTRDPS